jgi:hypothetical protein
MSFTRLASACAYLAAVAGLGYSVTFVATTDDDSRFGEGLEGAFLLAGGVLAVAVFTALHQHTRDRDGSYALLGLLFGVAGAFGAAIHGAYQLALAVENSAALDLPNAIDPRGFLTFGVTGAAVAIFASLLGGRLRVIGLVFATLLEILWIGRLVGGSADDVALLIPAALAGLVANPLWYVLVGRELVARATAPARAA